MIASENTISDGQIETVVSRLRDALRKHRDEFSAADAQRVLGTKNIGIKLLAPIRRIADIECDFLTRLAVDVDRSMPPYSMLQSSGWSFGNDGFDSHELYGTMPMGKGETADLYLFKPKKNSKLSIEDEFDSRGLIPADPYSLVAMNAAEPEFCRYHRNATIWKNPDGQWCGMLVSHPLFSNGFEGDKNIFVFHLHRVTGWGDNDTCFFAGFKK